MSNIAPDLRYKSKSWILSHLDVVDSPDKMMLSKLIKEEHQKSFLHKKYYISLLLNYIKKCFNLKRMMVYLQCEMHMVM